jgi:hypothetical protein
MSLRSKPEPCSSTGDCPRSGQRFCTLGSVPLPFPHRLLLPHFSITLLKATSTGQLNTILTFYEITDPPVESPLSGLPISLLKKAVSILEKTGRAQVIGIADGEGVRFFAGSGR